MKLLNQNNYPASLVAAAQAEIDKSKSYIFAYPARMGVTTLIDSPLIPRLLKERYEEIAVDVDDYYEIMDGIAWDTFLRSFEPASVQSQVRLEAQMDGVAVVGKPDIWMPQTGTIADYKRCKVASLRFEHDNWIKQLNCYAYLMKVVFGLDVKKLLIYPLLKDWRIQEEWREAKDYPLHRVPAFELPLWPMDEQKQYIEDQLHHHSVARNAGCSPDEKWQKDDVWAVMKKGRQAALRVLPSYRESQLWCAEKDINLNDEQFSIVKRAGECVRCKHYCPVRSCCPEAKNG